mmetsp:Transcript_68816/g.224187  ORF Transcript_68816/g.224187 Transcript_68816/m.224187 type:complete len:204 (-) Transcript_68816:147-758(-)
MPTTARSAARSRADGTSGDGAANETRVVLALRNAGGSAPPKSSRARRAPVPDDVGDRAAGSGRAGDVAVTGVDQSFHETGEPERAIGSRGMAWVSRREAPRAMPLLPSKRQVSRSVTPRPLPSESLSAGAASGAVVEGEDAEGRTDALLDFRIPMSHVDRADAGLPPADHCVPAAPLAAPPGVRRSCRPSSSSNRSACSMTVP